ncbi:hypothetical protein GF342_00280 [Candidatus Woesearchaeota archaeon]|nr:hypothetical protein [Candidatus Woesearchaeota archaeon]
MKRLCVVMILVSLLLMSACQQTLKTTSSKNAGVITAPSAPSTEWCKAGELTTEDGVKTVIQGMTAYKNKSMCYATTALQSDGGTLPYTVFFDQERTDVYVVIGSGDNATEVHLSR